MWCKISANKYENSIQTIERIQLIHLYIDNLKVSHRSMISNDSYFLNGDYCVIDSLKKL